MLLTSSLIAAQQSQLNITFSPTFRGELLMLEKSYPFQNDSIEFENLKYYVSNIELYYDEKKIYSLAKKYHLINSAEKKSLEINIDTKLVSTFNNIRFSIGIDSITNVSGAMAGDLDPTNNMYWTWQSGYINLKLEGKTRICPARNHFFQFHIGGYKHPYNCLQSVKLNIKNQHLINIELPIDQFLEKIDVSKTYEIMSPSNNAKQMAAIISTLFKVQE
jgi:hypothetical protein